jgi:lipoyl(octanoyl) transferase
MTSCCIGKMGAFTAAEMNTKDLITVRLGRTRYAPVWDLQKHVFNRRLNREGADVLLLTEHEHVYTFGTGSSDDHLLASGPELRSLGADVHHVDRGGDVTYHGPGQLVGYPIIRLDDAGLNAHGYLRALEEVLIRTCASYGIAAQRDPGLTGVWVGADKIAAMGIRVAHWVTMHGFALNVSTDLSYFGRIIPCGIFHKGVTSLEQLLHRPVPVKEVTDRFIEHFAVVFRYNISETGQADFDNIMNRKTQVECLQ